MNAFPANWLEKQVTVVPLVGSLKQYPVRASSAAKKVFHLIDCKEMGVSYCCPERDTKFTWRWNMIGIIRFHKQNSGPIPRTPFNTGSYGKTRPGAEDWSDRGKWSDRWTGPLAERFDRWTSTVHKISIGLVVYLRRTCWLCFFVENRDYQKLFHRRVG